MGSLVYERVIREGEKLEHLFSEGGLDVLEMAILEVHQPNFLREKKEFGNIMELEQQWHIQYDKSEYIGYNKLQEIFENGVQKHSVGFMCQGDFSNLSGEKVYIEEEKKKGSLLSFFIPRKGFIATPILIDINILVFIPKRPSG